MRRCRRLAIPLIAILAWEGTLSAQTSGAPALPEVFQAVVDCREIAEPAQRLACYDANVTSMQDAQARQDLVVADREQIREAKRGLFGIVLPDLKLFARDEEDEINEIESTITRVSTDGRGKWVFVIADGARWAQTDTRPIRPDPGDSIRIRRAAMGSYFANIDGAVAIRVKRMN